MEILRRVVMAERRIPLLKCMIQRVTRTLPVMNELLITKTACKGFTAIGHASGSDMKMFTKSIRSYLLSLRRGMNA